MEKLSIINYQTTKKEGVNVAFKKVKKQDSFAQWFIDSFGIEKYNTLINHEKNKQNNIDIWSISKRSTTIIHFNCENKDYHKFSLSADKYYKGNRCKYCGRTKYVHPMDSFGQYMIDNYGLQYLKKIWSQKNEKSPFKFSIGTQQKAHFNCSECGEYMSYSQIKNYVVSNKICKNCSGNISSLHRKVINYVNEKYSFINTEYNCTIIPINPVTKYPLPYDIQIEQLKLIIEVNGKQHYELLGKTSKWADGLSSIQYLAKRKKYDEYKKQYALSKGYHYLVIPYWTEQKDEYKMIIDNKIKEITCQQRLIREDAISDSDATV